jgi:catechol 2,3-dioxygenase-like lactoylglutathione lyase family enzyme
MPASDHTKHDRLLPAESVVACDAVRSSAISRALRRTMRLRLRLRLAASQFRSGLILTIILAAVLSFNPPVRAMELIGLDHFAINVTDLQRSADWYQRVLGFTVLHKWGTTWMVGRDNIKIGLFLRPDAKPLPDIDSQLIIQHVAFLVDGDKFADAQQALTQAGVKFDPPEDTGIAYSIFFNDPDGHLLEITTYHAVPAPAPPSNASTSPQKQ